MYDFCFVLDSNTRRHRNRAWPVVTPNMELEMCLIADDLTLTLCPPQNRSIPTLVGTTDGAGALNQRTVP